MIDRYTLPKMGAIWSEEAHWRAMLQVELAACRAMARIGWIPRADLAAIQRKAKIATEGSPEQQRRTVDRIKQIEERTQHDVVAFVEQLQDRIGRPGRWLHFGLTSSDVLDTASACQLRDAADVLVQDLVALRKVVRRQAIRYRRTTCVGRTHGIHAEPTTFGLKLAVWHDELGRHEEMMRRIRDLVAVGKLSGAVGVYANTDPRIEAMVCKELGLAPARISTQIIQRDRHARYVAVLAIIGGSIEKFAMEIRHLQRTEVREAEEPFGRGQKGSSAMPHKRNPVVSERLCGLARLLRGNAQAALENMALWHERDISHSSVERVILPDSSIVLDYMLNTFAKVLEGLVVYPKRMLENLEATRGLIYSERVLLALIRKGLMRKAAYELVQRSAMRAWDSGVAFGHVLTRDPGIRRHLSEAEIRQACDLKHHLRHADRLFARVMGGER